MPEIQTTITEDKAYKPSAPDGPRRRFFIETEVCRWEVFIWRFEIVETGTPVYRAVTSEGHSAYGMTANETLNDLAGVMKRKLSAQQNDTARVSLDTVRDYLDPRDAAIEEDKAAARTDSHRPLFAKLFGGWLI